MGPTLVAQDTVSGWAQWGGSRRDFRVASIEIAATWPVEGPAAVWSRPLAGGFGGIAVAGDLMFTMLRQGEEEVALALACADGATQWRSATSAVVDCELEYGYGPFATPLVDADRVFFLGGTGILSAHARVDGALVWRRELGKDLPSARPTRGFAASPIMAGGSLLVPVGANGASVVAFDPADGSTRWRRHEFGVDFASPIVVRVGSFDHVVCHMQEEVIGISPDTGDLLWRIASRGERTQHVISPLDLGGGCVLVSTTYGVERLRLTAGASTPTVSWQSPRIRAQVGNLIALPEKGMVLGASSCNTGALLVALDDATGSMLWRDRAIDCGYLWAVGDFLLSLARDGELVLARASRTGLEVVGRCQPLTGDECWSAPAMSGTRLLLKDDRRIVALELGK